MNEELKNYVNAYMDGEEVEFTWGEKIHWLPVNSLGTFDREDAEFRIRDTMHGRWQRVIDEGYMCKFWSTESKPDDYDYGKLTEYAPAGDSECPYNHPFTNNGKQWCKYCEVLREKGIKQPYFQGDPIPKIEGEGAVYLEDGSIEIFYNVDDYEDRDWSEIVAYIDM